MLHLSCGKTIALVQIMGSAYYQDRVSAAPNELRVHLASIICRLDAQHLANEVVRYQSTTAFDRDGLAKVEQLHRNGKSSVAFTKIPDPRRGRDRRHYGAQHTDCDHW